MLVFGGVVFFFPGQPFSFGTKKGRRAQGRNLFDVGESSGCPAGLDEKREDSNGFFAGVIKCHPFLRNQTMQIYSNFEGFPL